MKLVVTDLDGTLLNENSAVSEVTRKTVQKLIDSGVKFAIATGRGLNSTKKIKDVIGHDIYLICNNGATIYDTNEKKIFELAMNKSEVETVITYFREKNLIYNGMYDDNIFTDEGTEESVKTIEKGFNIVKVKDLDEFPIMTKILVKNDPQVIVDLQKDMLKKFSSFLDITISSPICLDVVHKNCTKGEGVKVISKRLNISPNEIMVFGDGGNDFEMLKVAGHPVIMENGLPILKEKIKNVAPNNTEDGVAKYLKMYFNL